MDRRAKRNAPDNAATNTGNKDNAAVLAITKALLAAFLTALTGAITTDFATAISAVRPVSTPRGSVEIDPFDTKSMDPTSRDGRGQWYKATEKNGGWK